MDILEQIMDLKNREIISERFKSGDDPKTIEDPNLKEAAIKEIANYSFSNSAGRSIRKEFSRKVWPVFEMYGRLKLVKMGYKAVKDSHVDAFWKAVPTIEKQIRGAFIEAEFHETVNIMIRTLRQISKNPEDERNKARAIMSGANLRELIVLLGSDKGINVETQKDPDGIKGFDKITIGRGESDLPEQEAMAVNEGIDDMFSNGILRLLRRNFKTGGWEFFAMYARLKLYEEGLNSVRRKDVDEFFDSFRFVRRKLKDGLLAADLKKEMPALRRLMKRAMNAESGSQKRRTSRAAGITVLAMIERVAASVGIYFRKKPIKGKHWFKLNKARKSVEDMIKLKDEDPEHYALKKKQKEEFRKTVEAAEEKILKAGLKPKRSFLMQKPIMVGVDPDLAGTKEEKTEIVFDEISGNVMPVAEWIEQRNGELAELESLNNFKMYPDEDDLEELRVYQDSEVEKAMEEQEIRYMAVTDDKKKQNNVTRVMPVVTIGEGDEARDVIAGNITEQGSKGEVGYVPTKFSGIPLDSMISQYGRMIEGGGYTLNTETGRRVKVEIQGGPDGVISRAEHEPYMTVAGDGSLLIHVHKKVARGEDREAMLAKGTTGLRSAMMELDKSPWVENVQRDWTDTRRVFKADPEGFLQIKAALQNFTMSQAAVEKMQEHLVKAKSREDATTRERLGQYQPAMLGGFKDELESRGDEGNMVKSRFKLNSAQLKALAYLDANGDKGICALETGVGKTLTAVAYIQNLKRKGLMDDGGKVLYVAPSKLTGNLENQAKKFVQDHEGWKGMVDSLSSRKFLSATKKDPDFMGQYVAVIFDEATETIAGGLGGGKSKTSQSAQKDHPRKVMLTASPMNKSPVELYTLNAIVNNIDIANNKEERKKMFSFLAGYCEKMGSRYVGISKDPAKQKAFRQWAKETMFFADKEDVDGYTLPGHTRETEKILIEGKVQRKHKALVKRIYSHLRKLRTQLEELDESDGPYKVNRRNVTREEWLADKKLRMAERIRSSEGSSTRKYKDGFKELEMLNLLPSRYYRIKSSARSAGVRWAEAKTFVSEVSGGSSVERAAAQADISLKKANKIHDNFDYSYDLNGNPKGDRAAEKIMEGMQKGHRYVLFTDSPDMARSTANLIAQKVGGKHAVAFSDKWELWIDGQVARTFRKKGYPEKGETPPKPVPEGETYEKDEWIDFIISHWVNPVESDIHSIILTKSYSHGVNLQQFDQVIHLDRNDWNSETMKQRTARVWRQGQESPVTETNIDNAYSEESDELAMTLDDVMGDIQKYDEILFQELIKDSKDADMMEGWGNIEKKKTSFYALDRDAAKVELEPNISKVAELSNDNHNIEEIEE